MDILIDLVRSDELEETTRLAWRWIYWCGGLGAISGVLAGLGLWMKRKNAPNPAGRVITSRNVVWAVVIAVVAAVGASLAVWFFHFSRYYALKPSGWIPGVLATVITAVLFGAAATALARRTH